MSQPFFVDQTGRPLEDYKHTTPSTEVETFVEEPIHVIAARQHAKDSTKKDTDKQHAFTLHRTYTGAGCAVCGKDHK